MKKEKIMIKHLKKIRNKLNILNLKIKYKFIINYIVLTAIDFFK